MKLALKSQQAVQLGQQKQGMRDTSKFGEPCGADGIGDDGSRMIPLMATSWVSVSPMAFVDGEKKPLKARRV